jgi:ribonuclease P protein component
MHASFRKYEKLCSKKYIDNLFKFGESFVVYPLRLYYNTAPYKSITGTQVVFAISHRNFRKAHQRNLIRRRMREAYRKNKHIISPPLQPLNFTLNIGFYYFSNKIENYSCIEQAMKKALLVITDYYSSHIAKEK